MNHPLPTLEQIRSTAAWLAPQLVRTPTMSYYGEVLSDLLGAESELILKLELFQKTGSFKPRGALNVIRQLGQAEKDCGVTAFSAGNHAIATAFAAAKSGVSAKVVMPKSANPYRVDKCLQYGAEVVFAQDMKALIGAVKSLEASEGRTLIHPFEGVHTSEGTATIGLELCEDGGDLDAVVVPVGGGGLISGIASAVKALQPACEVYGVEPEQACGMSESLRLGAPLESVEVCSIADSLSAPMHKPYSFSVIQQTVTDVVTVSDQAIKDAMWMMFGDLKLAVEPAGACAVAALIGPLKQRLSGKRVGLIICGANIDIETHHQLIATATGFPG